MGAAPEAILKLQKEANLEALTKNEIRAIAFVHFGGQLLKESGKKSEMIHQFQKLIDAQPAILPALTATVAATPALTLATGATPAPTLAGPAPRGELPLHTAKQAAPKKRKRPAAESESEAESEAESEPEDEGPSQPERNQAVVSEDEAEYNIERISDMRKVGRRNEYLVHWEGHEVPTWEPTSILATTEALRAWKAVQV